MSVIIKGMQLPRKSEHRECSIAVVQNRPVSIAFSRTKTTPLECCECAEIPTPHGRLIDADELIKKLKRHRDMCGDIETQYGIDTAIRILRNIPTIIEAEE